MGEELIWITDRNYFKEIYFQVIPESNELPEDFVNRTTNILSNHDAKVIRATAFGDLNRKDETCNLLKAKLGNLNFPLTWVEGNNCGGNFINGISFWTISGLNVKRIYNNEKIVGSVFETNDAEFCFLGNICSNPGISSLEQTENTLERVEHLLKDAGFDFINTVRTWFYLDHILEWYDEFNKARTSFFDKCGVFGKMVPASTGIGGKNEKGSQVLMELLAIKPKNEKFKINAVRSPLQCPAEDYKSSFSRAVKYEDEAYKYITISGTASIDTDGKTAHLDDLNNQITLTFNVVEQILSSEGFNFNDCIRAYAYCKKKSYADALSLYLKKNLQGTLPIILTKNDICRKDLLFELEMDAAKPLFS